MAASCAGGGFAAGTPLQWLPALQQLLVHLQEDNGDSSPRLRMQIFAPEYPLSPEATYPAAVEAAVAAYVWAATSSGLAAKHIFLGECREWGPSSECLLELEG